jgi:2-polyprenyl-3-methyl-5-hydroxy-6-metoxy-1,4-benzoquinol methylase
MSSTQVRSLEGAFYQYMHHLGQVDAEANRRVLEFYTPYFATCQHVLDVGCGEGQFIEALAALGVNASGIDADANMVQGCQMKGLQVQQADLFQYLPQHAHEYDGILCSNVIEHMTLSDVLRLLELATASLLPGGVLLFATPNPESLIVHLCEFWRDATHVRLYNRSLLEFLLSWAGLTQVQSRENPVAAWTPPEEMQSIPSLLEHLPSWQSPTLPKAAGQPPAQMDARPRWRRTVSAYRRRLARWLVQPLFYEELGTLKEQFAAWTERLAALESALEVRRTTAQRVGSALYISESRFLVASREIFVAGFKPSTVVPERR